MTPTAEAVAAVTALWLALPIFLWALVETAQNRFEPIGPRLIGGFLSLATAMLIGGLELFLTATLSEAPQVTPNVRAQPRPSEAREPKAVRA